MITEFFLELVFGIVTSLLSLLGNFTFPTSSITSAFSVLASFLQGASYFFPMGTLFSCIGLILGFYVLSFSVSLLNWIIRKIPFLN